MKTMKRFVSLALVLVLIFGFAAAETLSFGQKSTEVQKLQQRLYYLGFLSVSPDGDYGQKTADAVTDFQTFFAAKGQGLTVTGEADEKTQSILYDDSIADQSYALKQGDKNGYVRRTQRRLVELGYLTGLADGAYGAKTTGAVKAFQQMLIDNGATGIQATGNADIATLDYLYSELLGFRIETPGYYSSSKPISLAAGNLYSEAAVLIDAKTGVILFGKSEEKQMNPASTTKIMTLLLGVEYGNFDNTVTVPASAGNIPGDSSRVPIQVGEKMPYRDLLYGLMIRSGNDAANAIATLKSGSVEEFVQAMNDKAKELGLTGTHYTNPHGYHHANHYTTAEDMAKLLSKALENKEFAEIFRTHSYKMSATNVRSARTLQVSYDLFKSTSKYYCADAVGGKTGFTSAAGYCFVGMAERNGVQLIAVVFNGGDSKYYRWTDAKRLFDYGFAAKGV